MKKNALIEAVDIPDKGTATRLKITKERYELFGKSFTGQAKLVDGNHRVLRKLDFTVPEEVVNQWGDDDTLIVNYVADLLAVDVISIEDIESKEKSKKEDLLTRLRKARVQRTADRLPVEESDLIVAP